MDVPFHFGILPHLNASFVLFEEMNRGKARTELVLQDMRDGDCILVYGRNAAEDARRRLSERMLQNVTVVAFKEEDFVDNPHYMSKIENRASRSVRPGGRIHVDHTLIHKIVEIGLIQISHNVGYVVGMIGEENHRSKFLAEESKRLHQTYPIDKNSRS